MTRFLCLVALVGCSAPSSVQETRRAPVESRAPARILVNGRDAPDLATALERLPKEGGRIELSAGVFRERVVVRKAHVVIVGQGPQTRLELPPSVDWKAWSDAILDIEAGDVRVASLAIAGAAVATRETNQTGVHVGAVGECAIDHVVFTGQSRSSGLNTALVLDGAHHCVLRDNSIDSIVGTGSGDGNGYGFLINGDGNVIAKNTFVFAPGRGRHCIYLAAASLDVVSENSCIGGENTAIPIFSYPDQSPSELNVVVGNIVRGLRPTSPPLEAQGAISIEQNARFNEIAGNLVEDVGMNGVAVTDNGGAPAPRWNTIRDNIIRRTASSGILLKGASFTAVLNNVIEDSAVRSPAGSAPPAIVVLNSTLAPIAQGNRLVHNTVRGGALTPFALVVQEGARGTVVLGNELAAGRTGSFLDRGERTLFEAP